MASLSLYCDGLTLDPLPSSCGGPALDPPSPSPMHMDSEAKIQNFFNHISNSFSSTKSSGSLKRKSNTLSDMLTSLKRLAVDPRDQAQEAGEWQKQILKARKALFKRQRTHKFLSEISSGPAPSMGPPCMELIGGLSSHEMLNQPVRRSQRTSLKLGENHCPRKRIPIGPLFQADVPEWICPPNEKGVLDNQNDSRWLGTQIWPIKGGGRQTSDEIIGKGRPDLCVCTSAGSMNCVRFHVNMERLHVKSDLGPAFSHLGFEGMGEEVSKLWTQEEQIKFDDLVRLNPISEGKSFWEPALKYFTHKNRQDIVSYYFNVFVLRWMSIRTRLLSGTAVDSDDDM